MGSRPVQQWISLIRAEITGMLNESRYVLDNINVFIIDDNRHMRGLVKSILHALGVKEIGEAGDAADAFTELQHFTADIIIVDWYMEPLDGLDFVRLMRTAKDSPNPYIPIIMLTGYTEYRRVAEARDAGINEFLAKPISPRDLYLRIASIIDHPRPFVRARGYFGPDRRRYNVGVPRGLRERRKKELEKADEMVG
ncbi:MAG: two-component system chemotaxis response regulator CheY [Alphaproteobacteria bacterium]